MTTLPTDEEITKNSLFYEEPTSRSVYVHGSKAMRRCAKAVIAERDFELAQLRSAIQEAAREHNEQNAKIAELEKELSNIKSVCCFCGKPLVIFVGAKQRTGMRYFHAECFDRYNKLEQLEKENAELREQLEKWTSQEPTIVELEQERDQLRKEVAWFEKEVAFQRTRLDADLNALRSENAKLREECAAAEHSAQVWQNALRGGVLDCQHWFNDAEKLRNAIREAARNLEQSAAPFDHACTILREALNDSGGVESRHANHTQDDARLEAVPLAENANQSGLKYASERGVMDRPHSDSSASPAVTFYIASKTSHADKWRKLRERFNITSSWIDEAEEGQSASYEELAMRCLEDVKRADFVLLYCENDEVLKGALIEAGMALALGKEVRCVGEGNLSRVFKKHPLWSSHASVEEALTSTPNQERTEEHG